MEKVFQVEVWLHIVPRIRQEAEISSGAPYPSSLSSGAYHFLDEWIKLTTKELTAFNREFSRQDINAHDLNTFTLSTILKI